MAVFSGCLSVDESEIVIANWLGSQNHNWGREAHRPLCVGTSGAFRYFEWDFRPETQEGFRESNLPAGDINLDIHARAVETDDCATADLAWARSP